VIFYKFDYEEIMNTEFVGMKRPVLLRDELSVKHEEQRKTSPSKIPYFNANPKTDIDEPDAELETEKENEVLFIDVQNGKCVFWKNYVCCVLYKKIIYMTTGNVYSYTYFFCPLHLRDWNSD
jgi:hypothetical protein